jgi:very-short-patch-repair endonuclease
MGVLAGCQHGVVTLAQLRGCGFTADAARGLLRRGEIRRRHRGVYLVGPVPGPRWREMAAVLACGPGAALSHRSGITLYELLPYEPGSRPVHVTVHGRHRRADAGIVVHQTASLRSHEIREREGIPVTAPIRTLIDFACTCNDNELERVVAEAFALGLTNRSAVLRAAEVHQGRRGVGRLKALLAAGPPARTRSAPERRLLAAIRAAHLPDPEVNARLGRWEVDFLWRKARLVVELDAYSTHSSPRAFERDRRKDAELSARGFTVQRFTANRVRFDIDTVIAWLRATL